MAFSDERTSLMLQLQDIQHQDERRKQLIQLCVMKAIYLQNSQNKDKKQEEKTKAAKENSTPVSLAPSSTQIQGDPDVLQRKIHTFEIQVASLKSQLSTKEQAHAAKVDELRNEIERLQKQSGVESKKLANSSRTGRSRLILNRPKLTTAGSPISRARPVSSFFANSPFSDQKSGRGNSFSGVGITSVAAQASLKLSRRVEKPGDVFSPNNSSAESTPQKSKSASNVLVDLGRPERKKNSGENGESTIDSHPENSEQSQTSNMTVSDPEETFQSANTTFESSREKKSKKRKIRLVSSEASKLILASQDKGLEEGDDLTSVKYYQDDNFEKDMHSPVPAQKRSLAAEPAKKKHVFKIG